MSLDPRSDAELVRGAAGGDAAAVEELYRRHAEAAWRVGNAVARNRDDAADAVSEAFARVLQRVAAGRLVVDGSLRPYLLAAVRNAAIDNMRRAAKVDLRDGDRDERSPLPEPQERAFASLDAALIASAFRTLPERWRSVLWLTEVEGMEPREVADVLGVTPNNAAQLAVRARAALRTRYLQEHLGPSASDACQATVEKLGAYVGGKLSPRDVAAVDQHLAGCEACRERAAELEEIGSKLRKIVLPLPLVLAPKGVDALRASALSPVSSDDRVGGAFWNDLSTRLQKPLVSVTAGLTALGLIAAGVIGNPSGRLPDNRVPFAAPATDAAPVATLPAADPIGSSVPGLGFDSLPASVNVPDAFDGADDSDSSAPLTGTGAAPGDPAAPPAPAAPTTPASSDPGQTEPAPVAQLTAEVDLGPVSAAVGGGAGDGSTTGIRVNDTVVLADPSPDTADDEPAATVTVDSEVTGEQTVSVPLSAL